MLEREVLERKDVQGKDQRWCIFKCACCRGKCACGGRTDGWGRSVPVKISIHVRSCEKDLGKKKRGCTRPDAGEIGMDGLGRSLCRGKCACRRGDEGMG